MAGTPGYVRALAMNPPDGRANPNLLCFRNSGGLLGKGVCWWHSRFTRNALYKAYFLQEHPGPSRSEANRLIGKIMSGKEAVPIPGYGNLREFSRDHRRSIQAVLERRQVFEGVFRFAWVDGLIGRSSLAPGKMGVLMDRLHTRASSEELTYVKFQTPGLDAHSLLITGVEPLPCDGYSVGYLDSNLPGHSVTEYRRGEGSLRLATGMTGVPHI